MQFSGGTNKADTDLLRFRFYSFELIASQYFMHRWQFTWTHSDVTKHTANGTEKKQVAAGEALTIEIISLSQNQFICTI